MRVVDFGVHPLRRDVDEPDEEVAENVSIPSGVSILRTVRPGYPPSSTSGLLERTRPLKGAL